jgi:hypothetical protein
MMRRALVTANQLEAAARAVPRVGNKLTCRGARERGWQPALAQFPREGDENGRGEHGERTRGGARGDVWEETSEDWRQG